MAQAINQLHMMQQSKHSHLTTQAARKPWQLKQQPPAPAPALADMYSQQQCTTMCGHRRRHVHQQQLETLIQHPNDATSN